MTFWRNKSIIWKLSRQQQQGFMPCVIFILHISHIFSQNTSHTHTWKMLIWTDSDTHRCFCLRPVLTQCRAAPRPPVDCRTLSPPALDTPLLHQWGTGSLFWCECAPPWPRSGRSIPLSTVTTRTTRSHRSPWSWRRPGRSQGVSPGSTGCKRNIRKGKFMSQLFPRERIFNQLLLPQDPHPNNFPVTPQRQALKTLNSAENRAPEISSRHRSWNRL